MDIREDAAQYYDYQSFPIDDVPFYLARVGSEEARVLELGCGTGRVLVPLSAACGFIHGVDSSSAMLARCRERMERAGLSAEEAQVTEGDITRLALDARFDLIIAPFRVLQALETDAQVAGLMQGIRQHLVPGGRAILNAFRPFRERGELLRSWCTAGEHTEGETPLPDGSRLIRSHRRPRLQSDPLVVYPELIYRKVAPDGRLVDEVVLPIAMRCWYPADLEQLVADHGFRTTGRWGGYHGEAWGEGPELVIEFADGSREDAAQAAPNALSCTQNG